MRWGVVNLSSATESGLTVSSCGKYFSVCPATRAAIAGDREGICETFDDAFGPDRLWRDGDPKWVAEANALCGENWLRFWKNWEHARSPIGWVKDRAREVHEWDDLQGG